jgi:hypothetical protein
MRFANRNPNRPICQQAIKPDWIVRAARTWQANQVWAPHYFGFVALVLETMRAPATLA